MTTRDSLTTLCSKLWLWNDAKFIGYNTRKGSRMYGTLKKVPLSSCIETPCAENLMVGLGLGLALHHRALPVVCFERHEFALFGLGLLAAFADKFDRVSPGVRFPMIVRVVAGGTKPLWPGEQHCSNYGSALMEAMPNSVFLFAKYGVTYEDVISALESSRSGIVVIMEERDGYEQTPRN